MTCDEAIRILDPETSNATLMEMMGGTWDRSMALKLCAQARNMVLQALREKQNGGWISVKDRNPNSDQLKRSEYFDFLCRVIISSQGGTFHKETRTIKFDVLDKTWVCEGMIVTHWQPLPEPPKGE